MLLFVALQWQFSEGFRVLGGEQDKHRQFKRTFTENCRKAVLTRFNDRCNAYDMHELAFGNTGIPLEIQNVCSMQNTKNRFLSSFICFTPIDTNIPLLAAMTTLVHGWRSLGVAKQ